MNPAEGRAAARRLTTLPLLILLVALLLPAAPPGAARAQGPVTMTVTPLFEGNYSRGKWLPLSIVLRNDGPATALTVAATVPGALARSVLELELAGGAEQRATLYAAMDEQTRELRVTAEAGGAVLAEARAEVRPRSGERMTALVSARPLLLRLPRREELFTLPFLTFDMAAADVPDHPAGLSSLALMVLGEAQTEAWSPAQRRAVWAWVASGGHLVIGGGLAGAAAAGLPEALRPADLGGQASLDGAALAAFAGAEAGPAGLTGSALTPRTGGLSYGPRGAPVWVQLPVGNGLVTQLAFDPGDPGLNGWAGAEALWDELLRPRLLITLADRFEANPEYAREQQMAASLGNLPTVTLPASEPLFIGLAIYAILAGPGLALALRRLDRQALGWVALPVLALLTGAAGVGVALVLRAEERIVTAATLVEQVGPDFARARTVVAALSPRAETFPATIGPGAVVRPLRGGAGSFVTVEGAAGDMAQQSGALALSVAPWALQGVLAEAIVELPALDAQLAVGESAIQVSVRNTTGQALSDVVVLYGEQRVRLGDMAPEAQASVSWPPPPGPGAVRPPLGASASDLLLGEELAAASRPGGRVDRRVLVRQALLNAAVGRGLLEPEAGPFVFAWLERSPLGLAVDAPEAASQEISLLVARPTIVGEGPASVPPGWLRVDLATDGNSVCSGASGRGISANPAPITTTLSLPPAMGAFAAEQLTLQLESDRPWPNAGVTTELFNWLEGAWVGVPFDGPGSLTIPEAGPFLQEGRVRLRLGGRIGEAGCLFIEGQARGSLPPAGP